MKSPLHLVSLATLSIVLVIAPAVGRDDPSAKKRAADDQKPSINFKNKMPIGRGDDDKATASFTVVIKLHGLEGAVKWKIDCQGRSANPELCAMAIEAQLGGPANPKRLPPEWKHTRDDTKLIIEGWTDPKTKAFFPVKSIKFESPDFDKKVWPTITLPSDETSE